jgi:hypothetical protein
LRGIGLDAIPASNGDETRFLNPIGIFHKDFPHNEADREVEGTAEGAQRGATQSHRPRLSTPSSTSIETWLEEGIRDERWSGLPLW